MRAWLHLWCSCGALALVWAAAEAAEPVETLYLEVLVNGLDQNLIVRVDRVGGGLYVAAADLLELGFAADKLPAATQDGIPLQDIPGLGAEYDARKQVLKLDVPAADLVAQVLTSSGSEQVPP